MRHDDLIRLPISALSFGHGSQALYSFLELLYLNSPKLPFSLQRLRDTWEDGLKLDLELLQLDVDLVCNGKSIGSTFSKLMKPDLQPLDVALPFLPLCLEHGDVGGKAWGVGIGES